MLDQSTRIPETAGMLAPILRTPDRPDNRTHTAVYPPVGNFWCATVLCSSEHRSCRSASAEQSMTPRALRMQHLDFRLIRLRRSASHSAIAIFRCAAKGSQSRDLMENPGVTFKLINSRRSASAERSKIHSCANAQYH